MSSELLYFDSRSFFEDFKRDVSQSREYIDIEVYIWESDPIADDILEALAAAAKRGVRVRLIVDGVGSLKWINSKIDEARTRGIEVYVFNPVNRPWAIHLWPKFNRRTHRKLFLIDRQILYTGSMNVMQETLHWRETGLRVIGHPGPVVARIYDFTWKMIKSKIYRFFSGARTELFHLLRHEHVVRTNQFFRLRGRLRKDIIQRISEAKERVWLTTPYFNPPTKFLRALASAARRGVDVRLILPGPSDIFFAPWIGQLHYKHLLRTGIQVYEYQPCILHAKVSMIDDWCTVGSSNLNYRSFKNDLELDIVLSSQESLQKAREQFEVDIGNSLKINSIAQLAWWKRWLARLVYRFFRWM